MGRGGEKGRAAVLPVVAADDRARYLALVNDKGRRFNVQIIPVGERWGRNDAVVNDSDEPLVEFFDATYADQKGFGPLGQPMGACYLLSTLLAHDRRTGIDLYGGVSEWQIDARGLQPLYAFLEEARRRWGRPEKASA